MQIFVFCSFLTIVILCDFFLKNDEIGKNYSIKYYEVLGFTTAV